MNYRFSEEKLQKILENKGFKNLSDFIKKAHVNRATLYNYLQGQPVFSFPFLKIAAKLGVTPIDLIALEPSPAVPRLPGMVKNLMGDALRHPQIGVFLFGSRLGASAKTLSDWDLGIATSYGNLKDAVFLDLKNNAENFSENSLETIDLVNFDGAPPWFLEGLQPKPLFLGGNLIARNRFLEKWEGIHGKDETQRVP